MEQKRGKGKQRFKKGGEQAGSRGGCLKKGVGVLGPPYELCILNGNALASSKLNY